MDENNPKILHFHKKRTPVSRKEMCESFETASLNLEFEDNSNNKIVQIFNSLKQYSSRITALDEIKAILGKKFEQMKEKLDSNYGAIKKNVDSIHKNYQTIRQVEDKIDENLVAIQSSFTTPTNQLKTAGTEEVISNLLTFIELFEAKHTMIEHLSAQGRINELKEQNGILYHLKYFELPQLENSLYKFLNDVISRKFSIPRNSDDEIAFATLALLCLGTKIFATILHFLLKEYYYLADASCQEGNIEMCNQYSSLSLRALEEFTNVLNGNESRIGLFDKVIDVLNDVKELDFITHDNNTAVELISREIQSLCGIKSELVTWSDLPNTKPVQQIKYNFDDSSIMTPVNGWKDRRKVSYAIQYVINDMLYMQVEDWSIPYTVYRKACPKLDIGMAPEGTVRLIFRKFDSDEPELVGVVKDSKQTEFRDIHRDLYTSALEPNDEIAVLDIAMLINDGANVSAIFEWRRQAIHAAAKSGKMKIVSTLVEKGANINARDVNGYTPLHIAAEEGFESFIKELIDNGANVNATSSLHWTALHVSAVKGHINTIKNLLDTEIEVNAKAKGGFTPLHMAISSNNIRVIEMLSSHVRIDVNALSEKRISPLHLATLGNFEESVDLLLTNNAIDTNLRSEGNLTALHLASLTGNANIVESLIYRNDTIINARSEEHWTPLHLAISFEKEIVTGILLNNTDIDINAKGKDQITPLHLACSTGQNDIISGLLDRNTNIEAREKNGYTPLFFAAKEGHLSAVKILVEKGANVNVKNEENNGPLLLSVCKKHRDVIQYFLEKNVIDYDIQDPLNSFLHYAALEGCLELVKYLTDVKGMDIHLLNGIGERPLHFAALSGNLDVVKYIADSEGLSLYEDTYQTYATTPLHLAALQGHLEVVKYLVGDKGANVNMKNDYGDTPLHLAALSSNYVKRKSFSDIGWVYTINLKESAFHSRHFYKKYAAQHGHMEIVKYLIDDNGADFNHTNKFGRNLLHFSAMSGNKDLVQYLVDIKHMDPNLKDNFNTYPLHNAVKYGHLNIVKYLIDIKEMDLNWAGSNGITFLHYAALYGHLEVVKYLVDDKQMDANIMSENDETPLHFAAQGGMLDVIQYLVDTKGVDLNIKSSGRNSNIGRWKRTKQVRFPVQYAVYYGYLAIVKYLIDDKQAEMNVLTDGNETILHLAVMRNKTAIAKYLIDEKKMDPYVKDNEGNTPLHYAVSLGCFNIFKYFLKIKKLDFDVKNKDGYTPLEYAVSIKDSVSSNLNYSSSSERLQILKDLIDEKKKEFETETEQNEFVLRLAFIGENLKMVKYLIDTNQMDLNVKDSVGETPLHYAVRKNLLPVVKYLVNEKEVNLNSKNQNGQTPLHLTALNSHDLDIAKYLIDEKQADLNIKTEQGQTLLHLAVLNNNLNMIKYLLDEKQMDPNVKDNFGNTLLHDAVQQSSFDAVKYLLDAKNIDLNVKDSNGRTPLHLAVLNEELEIVKYLIKVKDVNPNIPDNDGNTPMHLAVQQDDTKIAYSVNESNQLDIAILNSMGETPLDLTKNKVLYINLLSDHVRRSTSRKKRSVRTRSVRNGVKSFTGEKISTRDINRRILDCTNNETECGMLPSTHKEIENAPESVLDSYRNILKLQAQKAAPASVLEKESGAGDVGMAPRIGETTGYSNWPSSYEGATSHENTFFIKWLFHLLGLRSVVKRMNKAEELHFSSNRGYNDSSLPENLYWNEKRLKEAKELYK